MQYDDNDSFTQWSQLTSETGIGEATMQSVSRHFKQQFTYRILHVSISRYLKISQDISNSQATSHHLSSANSEWWNMIQPHFWCNLPIISSTTVAVFFPRRVTHIPPPHWDRKGRRDARSHRHPQGTQRWVGPTERSDQTAPGFFGLKMLRKVAMEIQQLVWIDMSWSNLFTDVN